MGVCRYMYFVWLKLDTMAAAASTTRVVKPGNRGMQTNDALEHSLLLHDADHRIRELGASPNKGRDEIEDLLAQRMHRLGMVCPDPDTLKRASAIVQAVSSTRATKTDKRSSAHGVKKKLKQLDRITPWAFEYICIYPRSPFELPGEVLNHAYGEARPVNPPNNIGLKLIVAATPYKKMKANRLDQTPHRDQTSIQGATHAVDAIVPLLDASPPSTAQPPVMNAGPFAALMGAFMHGMHMGSQNRSKQSVASGASHTPEEIEPDSDDLEKLHIPTQLAKSKILVQRMPCTRKKAQDSEAVPLCCKKDNTRSLLDVSPCPAHLNSLQDPLLKPWKANPKAVAALKVASAESAL